MLIGGRKLYYVILRGRHNCMCCLSLTIVKHSKFAFNRINFMLLILVNLSINKIKENNII
jgi:hypothetical protein